MSTVEDLSEFKQCAKRMFKLFMGNFPPLSRALVNAQCSQKLDFEDTCYCYRLPMAFVPPYMGNIGSMISKGVSFSGQPVPAGELELAHQ